MASRPSGVVSEVLPSGLRVVVEPLADFSSVAVGVWVLAGSRDEAESQSGISHFIEHLTFKGTAGRTARQIALEIDALGGSLNAYTSKEQTSFYAKVLGESLPQALDILGDIVLRSRFDPADIDKEREVVLQEISMVEDTPDDLVHDLHCREFWSGQALGWPILGTAESLGALKSEDVRAFHSAHYHAGRVLVTAAGAVSPEDLVSGVARAFEGMPPGPPPSPLPLPRPTPRVYVLRRPVEQVHFCLGFDGQPAAHGARYTLLLLNTVLGGGMSSRLFQTVREEHGLAYSVFSYHSGYHDAGLQTIYCGTSQEGFPKALELIRAETRRLAEDRVPELEMETARRQVKGSLLLGLESTGNRMNQLARNEIYFGRQVGVPEIAAAIDAVTADEVRDLAASLLGSAVPAVTVIGPVAEDEVRSLAGA